jgi:hypothetical protein
VNIRPFAIILLTGIILLSATACQNSTTLTTAATAQLIIYVDGQGSVIPNGGTFNIGETVTLTAVPKSGWLFDHWESAIGGNQNPTTITMDSDKKVTAYFLEEGTTAGGETEISGGGDIKSATSLQFVVDATPVGYYDYINYSARVMFRAEDIGSDGMKLRIDIINKGIDSYYSNAVRSVDLFRFLFDKSQQKALLANIGNHLYSEVDNYSSIQWNREVPSDEISEIYSELTYDLGYNKDHWRPTHGTQEDFVLSSWYFNDWVQAFEKHLSDLSQWTTGTWISPDGLITVHDILINPVFSDSIFTTEEVRGDEAPSNSGTGVFDLTTSKVDIKWGSDLLDVPSNDTEYSWPALNFDYSTNVPSVIVLVPPKGRWYTDLGFGIRNTLAELTDNFELEFTQTGSDRVAMNYYSDVAPLPGTYKMMAYSLVDGTKIWEKDLTFSGPNITIKSVDVKYWGTFWSYPVAMYWPELVAIEITNSGDLPVYGCYVRAWTYDDDWADKRALHMMDGPKIIWIGTPEIIWEDWSTSEDLLALMQATSYTETGTTTYFEGQGVFNTDGFGGTYINTVCDYWDEVQGVAVDSPKPHHLYIELVDYVEETWEYILLTTFSTTIVTPGVN